ncbi:unnamed protein product [Cyprideis torosa]|uniref:Uncharacterized protein n=1 Tax=Cyprideis torosa TaxID=163714 RepID=A0A7R8WJN0_9CRUS|nr:unnamed protein product [Cyprideis torosa]CAG0895905.1 unnamed protein product [Cyprideis torosa]
MKAKKRLEKYFKVRHQNPELYGNLDIQENTKLREIVEEGSTIVLPGTDFEGRRVVFHIAKRLDVCRFDASDLIRSWLLALETISQDEAVLCNGVTYVLDFDGVHWPYVAIWGPGQFQNVVSTGEKAFPLRHKNILIGNPPTGFWIMYEICKIAITSKIRDRIKVKNLDPGYLLESIPANILPKEYGGTRDMQELIDLWKEECFSQRDKVLTMDRTTYYMKEERGWFRSFMSFGSWLGSIPFEVLHKVRELMDNTITMG